MEDIVIFNNNNNNIIMKKWLNDEIQLNSNEIQTCCLDYSGSYILFEASFFCTLTQHESRKDMTTLNWTQWWSSNISKLSPFRFTTQRLQKWPLVNFTKLQPCRTEAESCDPLTGSAGQSAGHLFLHTLNHNSWKIASTDNILTTHNNTHSTRASIRQQTGQE